MQDLLARLFWRDAEIHREVAEYLEQFPGFAQARRAYEAVAKRVEEMVGFDLCDEFQTQLLNYSDYEVCAYYAFGLGLRREIIRQMLGKEQDGAEKAPRTDGGPQILDS